MTAPIDQSQQWVKCLEAATKPGQHQYIAKQDGKYTLIDEKKAKLNVKEIVEYSKTQFAQSKSAPERSKIIEGTEKIINAREVKINAAVKFSGHGAIASLVHFLSRPFLFIWSKFELHQIDNLKKTVQQMRSEVYQETKKAGQLTSANWNPVLGYTTAIPKDITIDAGSVMTTKTTYVAMKKQLDSDLKQRGETTTVSYVNQSGKVVNVDAKTLLKSSDSLLDIAKQVVRDEDVANYDKLLESKPDGVDKKEYIFVHMLYLVSQNSIMTIDFNGTLNHFQPYYGDPKQQHVDSFVDFASAKASATQVAFGVDRSKTERKPATFMVQMEFDCTKAGFTTPKTTVHLFNPGSFKEEDFQKGLSPKK